MPVCVVPVTYDHKEHAILDDDLIHDASPDGDRKPDDDRSVTVADLLDLHILVTHADRTSTYGTEYDDLDNARGRASDHVDLSYRRIQRAITAHDTRRVALSRLSPEERAEFDRRTT